MLYSVHRRYIYMTVNFHDLLKLKKNKTKAKTDMNTNNVTFGLDV